MKGTEVADWVGKVIPIYSPNTDRPWVHYGIIQSTQRYRKPYSYGRVQPDDKGNLLAIQQVYIDDKGKVLPGNGYIHHKPLSNLHARDGIQHHLEANEARRKAAAARQEAEVRRADARAQAQDDAERLGSLVPELRGLFVDHNGNVSLSAENFHTLVNTVERLREIERLRSS